MILGFTTNDLSRIGRLLTGDPPYRIAGLPPTARAAVVEALRRRFPELSLLWVTEDRRELSLLRELGLVLWPTDEQRTHQRAVTEPVLQRSRLLRELGSRPLLIAALPESLDGLANLGEQRRRRIYLRVGNEYLRDKIQQSLERAGYQRGLIAPATYDFRGDTVVIRDLDDRETRLEFFGDRLERIAAPVAVSELELPALALPGESSLCDYVAGVVQSASGSDITGLLLRFEDEGVDLGIRVAPFFHGQADRFCWYLRSLKDQGYHITARGTQPEFIRHLEELGIPFEQAGSPAPGWVMPEARRAHLTDRDFARLERPRSRALSLEKLQPGRIVVHRDYGLARFHSTVARTVDGVAREYLLLEFAAGDRLYLPIEQLDRLSRYLGASHPTLSRLGVGEWTALLARVRRASYDIALELLRRYARRSLRIGASLPPDPEEESRFAGRFRYSLTESQRQVIEEVLADMVSPKPMDRLVAGDVGYGKTEVAWRAAFRAAMNGRQVALVAPTTILAEQHLATARERFGGFAVNIEGISRFRSPAEQRKVLERLEQGRIDLIIGTHRLLSRDVRFANLGLVIIDEEQRFGVEDKERLRRLYEQVDVLTLTATPIPRTLEMSLGEIRPLSLIEEAPAGRRRTVTKLVPDAPETLREALGAELDRDGQAYVVVPRIRSIPSRVEELRRLFPETPIGVAHGQLPEQELARVMGAFAGGEIRILVASSIIENGLDLPRVNTIVIDNPFRFGLAELYQLRGRVGRSDLQAYCYLLRPERQSRESRLRLQALLEASERGSGLEVALRDLEIRGSGNVLGREQHGYLVGVGVALYTKLLEEAAAELAAGRSLQLVEAAVDLPLETALPNEFTDPEERLSIYRQVENCIDEAELAEVEGRLSERYGVLEPLRNLFAVKRLKLQSLGTPVAGIRMVRRPRPRGGSDPHLVLTLEREPSEAERTALGPGWRSRGIELRRRIDGGEESIPLAREALVILGQVSLTESKPTAKQSAENE